MTRAAKVVLWVISLAALLAVGLPSVLSYYDYQTRNALLAAIANELQIGASDEEMRGFMLRHTARFHRDDVFHHEYAGIVRQTVVDRALFDRKVQVVIKFHTNGTFERGDVRVFYTFL